MVLIYTGWYICLLVMIIFKGRKLIKGRKMDCYAAQSCSLKPGAVAAPSPVLRPLEAVGVARCWLGAEAQLLCHRRLCTFGHIPAPLFPPGGGEVWGILPFSQAGPCSACSPSHPLSAGSDFRSFERVFIRPPLVFRRFECLTAYSRQA